MSIVLRHFLRFLLKHFLGKVANQHFHNRAATEQSCGVETEVFA